MEWVLGGDQRLLAVSQPPLLLFITIYLLPLVIDVSWGGRASKPVEEDRC